MPVRAPRPSLRPFVGLLWSTDEMCLRGQGTIGFAGRSLGPRADCPEEPRDES